jgi:hypothetical protein
MEARYRAIALSRKETQVRFAADSSLEQGGFEPPVPLARFRGDFSGRRRGGRAISVVSKDFAFWGGPVVRIRFAPAASLSQQ